MGLFSRKKKSIKGNAGDALLWVSFAIAVLSWLLKSLKDFPQLPQKQTENEGANSSSS